MIATEIGPRGQSTQPIRRNHAKAWYYLVCAPGSLVAASSPVPRGRDPWAGRSRWGRGGRSWGSRRRGAPGGGRRRGRGTRPAGRGPSGPLRGEGGGGGADRNRQAVRTLPHPVPSSVGEGGGAEGPPGRPPIANKQEAGVVNTSLARAVAPRVREATASGAAMLGRSGPVSKPLGPKTSRVGWWGGAVRGKGVGPPAGDAEDGGGKAGGLLWREQRRQGPWGKPPGGGEGRRGRGSGPFRPPPPGTRGSPGAPRKVGSSSWSSVPSQKPSPKSSSSRQ